MITKLDRILDERDFQYSELAKILDLQNSEVPLHTLSSASHSPDNPVAQSRCGLELFLRHKLFEGYLQKNSMFHTTPPRGQFREQAGAAGGGLGDGMLEAVAHQQRGRERDKHNII